MRFSCPHVRVRDLKGLIRDRETFGATVAKANAAGCTRVRLGALVVVIWVLSSASGSVILAEIILLASPRDQEWYASKPDSGATRRPNVRVCF